MPAVPPAVTDPAPLVALFGRDRPVHPYGLADVDEPYWSRSRWWVRGEAAAGVLDLPGADTAVLYAVSVRDPAGTLDLLADLAPVLPDRIVVNGPRGTSARLAASFALEWVKDYRKLHLADVAALPAPDDGAVALGRADLDDLAALYATDPDAGDFFLPSLVDSGFYLGHREGQDLVAAAGVHVVSRTHRVAAIGNVATHPAHRRRGHARTLVATLCQRLLAEVDVVGLNVADANEGAFALYDRLGFEPVVAYEEAELRRRPT